MTKELESQLQKLLNINRDRLQWIADEEARGARFHGGASDGRYDGERTRLIQEADAILEKLEKSYKNPRAP